MVRYLSAASQVGLALHARAGWSSPVTRPLSPIARAAVGALVLVGLVFIAVFSPPLFNVVFGEEYPWYPAGVAYGAAYMLAAAGFVWLRDRLTLGMSLVLAMTGFTFFSAWALVRIADVVDVVFHPGSYYVLIQPLEIGVVGALGILHAVIVLGVLASAREWMMDATPHVGRAWPAAILAGVGFGIGLAAVGGEYAIILMPIRLPWFEANRDWVPLVHFLAAGALILDGRAAAAAGLMVSVAGALLAVSVIGAILSFGAWEVAWSLVPWLLFLAGYVAVAGMLIARANGRLRNPQPA